MALRRLLSSQRPLGSGQSKVIMVKKEVSIQLVVASRVWAKIVGTSNFSSLEGETSYFYKNLAYFCDMLNEIGQLNIDVNEDTCTWSLGRNGTFTVKDARYRIDQNILPTLAHTTTWDKSIPRKFDT
ncbi:hypothetical protein Tco_1456264 [Tanacetum coccineum]